MNKNKKEPRDTSKDPVDLSHFNTDEDFSGNVFTARIVPKKDPVWGDVKSTSFFAKDRKEAKKIAMKSIEEGGVVGNWEDYELIIENGAALQWAED